MMQLIFNTAILIFAISTVYYAVITNRLLTTQALQIKGLQNEMDFLWQYNPEAIKARFASMRS